MDLFNRLPVHRRPAMDLRMENKARGYGTTMMFLPSMAK